MKLQNSKSLDSVAIAKFVQASCYYPELRIIMVHDKQHIVDAGTLENATGLPVVQVATGPRHGFKRYASKIRTLSLKTRLPVQTVDRILAITWTRGNMPEPLRIAHLAAASKFPALALRA